MATLNIPDHTYARLAARAAALNTTVEQLAGPALDQLAREAPADLPYPEWKQLFDAWQTTVHARADRYPVGHTTDVSREAMYEGCGE